MAYIDYAAWQRANLDTSALEAELAWWRQTLAGAPALLEWQTDRPRPSTMSFAGAQLHFSAPAAVCQGVQQLAAAQQTTPFVVVLTALQVMPGMVSCERLLHLGHILDMAADNMVKQPQSVVRL